MNKIKNIVCILTVLILCCSNAYASGVFSDLTDDHWAYENIMFFYEKGVVEGTSAHTFSPDTFVTREQFAKMLSLVFDRGGYTPKSQSFTDVTEDMWSYAYIDYVKDYLPGYTSYDGSAQYKPYNVATRQDIVYAIVKISGVYNECTPDTAVLEQFADGDTVIYNRRDFVSVAVKQGWLKGYEDGTLKPENGITRAEALALLYRVISQKAPEVEEVTPSPEAQQPEAVTPPEEENVSALNGEYTYTVTAFNGFETTGTLRISFGEAVRVLHSEINYGEGIYNVEITEVTGKADDGIEVLLLISLDGNIEAADVAAKLTGFDGDKPAIVSDDGRWSINLKQMH